MGMLRKLRTAGAFAVVAVGVPAAVIGNMNHGQAVTTSNAGAALGSATNVATGTAATNTGTATGSSTGTTSTGTTSTGTTNLPADKMTVTGSTIEVSGPNADVVLLSAQMRTSTVADLTFQMAAECSIVTDVTTTGNDMQSAFGQVRIWVEVDGQAVGVMSNQPGQRTDDGKVVFCNQAYSSTTKGFTADPNASIETYLATKHANAFNWVATNVGNGVHTITVHAELTQDTTANGKADMVVGSRTLVVDTTTNAVNQAS
jgi:hypothetical protein